MNPDAKPNTGSQLKLIKPKSDFISLWEYSWLQALLVPKHLLVLLSRGWLNFRTM